MIAKLQRDWAQIAHDYMTGDILISELCARHKISRRTLYRRANKSGWSRLSAELAPPMFLIELKLWGAIELSLSELEIEMHSNRKLTALERERNAKTLARLVSVFDTLAKSAAAEAQEEPCARPQTEALDADAEAENLRKKLAALFEGHFANWQAEEQAAGPAEGEDARRSA